MLHGVSSSGDACIPHVVINEMPLFGMERSGSFDAIGDDTLLGFVTSFLPLFDRMWLRMVCRRFNSLVLSSQFNTELVVRHLDLSGGDDKRRYVNQNTGM